MTIDLYLNQEATLKTTTARDVYGKQTLTAGTPIKCRLQGSHKRLTNDSGEEFTADAEMWVKGSQAISNGNIIVWEGEQFRVVKIETKRTLTGSPNHKKILLVKTS